MLKLFYIKEDVGDAWCNLVRFTIIAAESKEQVWDVLYPNRAGDWVPDFKPVFSMYGHRTEEAAQKEYEKALRKYERNKDKMLQEYKDNKQKEIETFMEIPGTFADGKPRIILDDNPCSFNDF